MTKLAEDATNGLHYFLNQYAVVASTAYTISVYAKAAERRYLAVGFDDGGSNGVTCTFDLQTGTTVSIGQGTGVLIGVQMLPVGNGVYRCSTSGTVASTVLRAFCNLWINASTQFFPSYQGVAGNGVLIWGMQIEQGAFPTSYIPTTSVVVTRSVDLASMSFTPAASGTYRAEFIPAGAAGGLPYIVSGNAGSPAMAIGADTRLVASIRSGASVFSAVAPAMTFNAVNKTAFGWLTGASKAAVNGTLLGANAVALTVTGTTVQLGSDGVTPGNNALNGGLRRVSYWPRQLSDAEMQQVTT
jgi:hypothetical protein